MKRKGGGVVLEHAINSRVWPIFMRGFQLDPLLVGQSMLSIPVLVSPYRRIPSYKIKIKIKQEWFRTVTRLISFQTNVVGLVEDRWFDSNDACNSFGIALRKGMGENFRVLRLVSGVGRGCSFAWWHGNRAEDAVFLKVLSRFIGAFAIGFLSWLVLKSKDPCCRKKGGFSSFEML